MRRARERRALLVAGAVAGAALLALAIAVVATYEVVRKGELFSYSTGRIYEIRVLDSVTVYVEPEVRPSLSAVLDVFNAYMLVFLTGITVLAYALLRSLRAGAGHLRAFFGLAALGTGYLAADELLGIHETIGHNMRFLADIPGNEQPDGAIVAAYLVPVGAYLYGFRDLLLSSERAKRLFALGLGLALVAVAVDIVDGPGEELFETLATLAFLIGYLWLSADLLAGALRGEAVASGSRVAS